MIIGHDCINSPEQAGPQDRRSGLVDLDRVLESDGGIGDDKDYDKYGKHLINIRENEIVRI
jgi:hypothetical protein